MLTVGAFANMLMIEYIFVFLLSCTFLLAASVPTAKVPYFHNFAVPSSSFAMYTEAVA